MNAMVSWMTIFNKIQSCIIIIIYMYIDKFSEGFHRAEHTHIMHRISSERFVIYICMYYDIMIHVDVDKNCDYVIGIYDVGGTVVTNLATVVCGLETCAYIHIDIL